MRIKYTDTTLLVEIPFFRTRIAAVEKEPVALIIKGYVNESGRVTKQRDFIYESNKGKSVFFVATKEEAIEMLTK